MSLVLASWAVKSCCTAQSGITPSGWGIPRRTRWSGCAPATSKSVLVVSRGGRPVNAFWSLTVYDGKTQLLVANPINRYLINSPISR